MYALEPTRCPLVLSSPQAHRLHCALLFDLWAGALPPEVRHQGVPLPLLAIESEMWAMGKWGIEQIQHEENQRCAFYAPSTQHQSFSDAALWMSSPSAFPSRSVQEPLIDRCMPPSGVITPPEDAEEGSPSHPFSSNRGRPSSSSPVDPDEHEVDPSMQVMSLLNAR